MMSRKMVAISLACVAFALALLAIKGCRTQETTHLSIDEYPIIVVASAGDLIGKTTLHFTCLNREECILPIETKDRFGSPNNPGIDEKGNLYLPFYDHSDIFYVDLTQQSARHIDTDPNLKDFYNLYPLYTYGKIILADRDTIIIVNEDFSYSVVQPETASEFIDVAIGGLVQGEKDEVIAFNTSPVRRDGKDFAQVFVVDLNSGNIAEVFLPAPASIETTPNTLTEWKPGKRYGLMFVSVTKDLDKLYYTFLGSDDSEENLQTRLGMFDTKSEKELHIYDSPSGCLSPNRYRQYKDYLFVSSGSGGPILLRLKDLSPVVDFGELQEKFQFDIQAIAPFGQYFLVGTANKAFVISQDGDVLREYPLPADLFGETYTFVEYLED